MLAISSNFTIPQVAVIIIIINHRDVFIIEIINWWRLLWWCGSDKKKTPTNNKLGQRANVETCEMINFFLSLINGWRGSEMERSRAIFRRVKRFPPSTRYSICCQFASRSITEAECSVECTRRISAYANDFARLMRNLRWIRRRKKKAQKCGSWKVKLNRNVIRRRVRWGEWNKKRASGMTSNRHSDDGYIHRPIRLPEIEKSFESITQSHARR